jgi:hypothetical protein
MSPEGFDRRCLGPCACPAVVGLICYPAYLGGNAARNSRYSTTNTPESAAENPGLHRRLGLLDAVTVGLGSMISAGVFAVLAPAAAAAG